MFDKGIYCESLCHVINADITDSPNATRIATALRSFQVEPRERSTIDNPRKYRVAIGLLRSCPYQVALRIYHIIASQHYHSHASSTPLYRSLASSNRTTTHRCPNHPCRSRAPCSICQREPQLEPRSRFRRLAQ